MSVKGRRLDVVFDRFGTKYGMGAGLTVFVDGKPAAHSGKIAKLKIDVSQARALSEKPKDVSRGSIFSSRRVSR